MKASSILLTLFLFSSASAKTFTNSYVSFELPSNWECSLERTEWTCRSNSPNVLKEAAIILTAKEVGPADTFAQYESYLKTPKTITDKAGKPVLSQIKQVKQVQINSQPWVDGMHLGSEVPFYYTRYLATVKQRIAILVTFSAHQRYYTKYSADFFKAIMSLRVIAAPELLAGSAGGSGSGGILGGSMGGLQMDGEELPSEPTGRSSSKTNALLLAVLCAAVGGYFMLKKNKKKGPRGPFSK